MPVVGDSCFQPLGRRVERHFTPGVSERGEDLSSSARGISGLGYRLSEDCEVQVDFAPPQMILICLGTDSITMTYCGHWKIWRHEDPSTGPALSDERLGCKFLLHVLYIQCSARASPSDAQLLRPVTSFSRSRGNRGRRYIGERLAVFVWCEQRK